MDKRLQFTFLVGFLILGTYFFVFDISISENTENDSLSKLAQKHFPSDQFFLQRSFPDASIDMIAYVEAMEMAKNGATSRGGFDNFDRDWRTEGPGNLGARVNTIAVHPKNDDIIFAGYSGGGVFRTMDGGATWKPIFDDQLFLAIGDIVFDPMEENTVYVGTGDPNISGFPFLGDGLYKSTDLGQTWKYIGLEKQRIISKILIHPTNNQILYVATMGLPFEPTRDRGLYKSSDGGKTWQQTLFLGEITGVIDVVFDKNDPAILYAAGWDRHRNNQVSLTFGQGAKIHKTTDGGNNWQQLAGGLPLEDQSRIGLASTPDGILAVYVNTNHHFQGLYKSIDKGNTWNALPTDLELNGFNNGLFGGFGWYFGKLRVNPQNDADITILGVQAWRTLNAGEHWDLVNKEASIGVHSDVHELIFTTSGKILLGTDGGIYRFDSNGKNWEDIENIPTSQVYRVAYNPHQPQNYYAGTQDNGTAGGNANAISSWEKIYGGDGFQMAFHPTESTIFYAESQRGNISVTMDGGLDWENASVGINSSDRINWDMPYFISPHDPNILFTGTHRVYKSTVGAVPQWEPISLDLTNGTTDDLRQTISTLDQSPINPALLYVGTTDGNIWRTTTSGDTWEQLSGLPQRYFTEVVASPNVLETVFATVSGYKNNDNTAHIYKSIDRGLTWESIAGNLPPLAINCLKAIPDQEDRILFVGTDGGVYGTLDGGEKWERLGDNMPIVAVYDIEWNEAENRLVAGTFARSVLSYSLDEIVEEDKLSSVNFQQQEKNVLIAYPNPVTTSLTFEFKNERPNRAVLIFIYNTSGKMIKQAKRKTEKEAYWQVDVNDLPAGIFLVKIQGEYFTFSEQFIKF